MKNLLPLLLALFSLFFINCNLNNRKPFVQKELYRSNNLIINQIAEHSFVHTSFLQTTDFGNVPCNGLIISNNKEAIIFDTPTNNETSEELITWLKDSLGCTIKGVIATHFHNDCVGGLFAFHERNIPSYANIETIKLVKEQNYELPKNGFKDSINLKVGTELLVARFFGEGHTKDNVVGYFPLDEVIFGGCLIKELDASKGFLGDANLEEWAKTVEKVKQAYPNVKLVVPGHGASGGQALFDYTIQLFNPVASNSLNTNEN